MKQQEIRTVCVIGGGLMGRQIALNTAIHGFTVKLTDSSPEILVKVVQWKEEYLSERIAKGKMSEDQVGKIQERFCVVGTLEEATKNVELVIEAIYENKEAKEEVFKKLDALVSQDTIIATNSSYMPSSQFAAVVKNPSRLANLHYFNPALVMKLTEVVQGPHTSDETVAALMDFSIKTGKDPIHLRKEIDGFIANRILRAVRNEAFYLLEQKIATPREIDTAAEKGLGYPMGPFRLQDLTGIDLAYQLAQNTFAETGKKPVGYDLIKKKYEAGEWGRKSGRGWYDYS
ncbi:MAG TPA: 3-hydroxyacyl-CoA dehydrogenase family protein [Negativicutes bacterium]|nr:3-hydroxyacyl-CoA dehydrogenase family protein [Negativicutes bacterium]